MHTTQFPGVTQQHALHPNIPLSRLVATAIRKDKQWAGMWVTKALAIALKHNIMVIGSHGSCMYFKSRSEHSRTHGQTVPYAAYPSGANTRQAASKHDVPIEALETATCFVVWDVKGHYSPAICSPSNSNSGGLDSTGLCSGSNPQGCMIMSSCCALVFLLLIGSPVTMLVIDKPQTCLQTDCKCMQCILLCSQGESSDAI